MKHILSLALVFTCLFTSCKKRTDSKNQTDTKLSYEVVFREKAAGVFEKWSTGEGSFEYFYEYTDRGRGPKFSEKITLKNGVIASQTISGVNYRKVNIEEKFSSNPSTVSWSNAKGDGEASYNASSLYFRFDGTPAIYEILAQNLIESKNHKVKLYPEGEASLLKKYNLTLKNGASVQLISVKGLDMNPKYIWLQSNEMIGKIDGNLHVIRSDFKSERLNMKKLQDSIEIDYLKQEATRLTHKINQTLVIQNVNVFTESGGLLFNQDVVVENNVIKNIYPFSKSKTLNKEAQVIDGSCKTLLPGMYDMHTHNNNSRGLLHIAGGITSVRDLANNKQLKKLSKQFNTNEIIGPRIVTFAGIIDGSGPYANQRNVVSSLEEGLKEVQVYKDLGYQQIKLYSSIKPEWVKPLADKSHDLGMRVSGHIPAYMTANQAINQGYNEIQHINMVFLNFLSDTIDTRTPLRHIMPAEHGAHLDLQSKEYIDFVNLLKEKNIVIDPTVALFEDMYVSRVGEVSPTYKPIASRLPVMNQRGFYSGGLPKSGYKIERYAKSLNKMLDVINDFYKQGIHIVPGTDGLPGFLYHRELEMYAKAGISNAEVLQLATIKSAELTGTSKDYGSIKVGKKADLILIDGSPLEDISNIRRVELTIKDGNLFYAKELYESLGIKHFK
ncbi:amidohydrolase family protein [Neotamlana laminarinivorans]|uniref:Amidohydrolase family protein n=1 Tax=Neotamlana laminarinivorans TaxID=2883124 RepID=A0A9X1I3R4_9FLAO|nr:amidohydrolase family protein [Tamlana laminarinivorans]MCB4800118.1 amidohydrolase family protein [Tamlana laminarinivorans]